MRRDLILIGVTGLLAAVAAFSLAHQTMCRRAARTPLQSLHDLAGLTRAFSLTADQTARIQALNDQWAPALETSCGQTCAARQKIAKALADGNISAAETDALLESLCKAYEAGERATLNHLQAVRAVLDPSQQAEFDRLLARCLCHSCVGDSPGEDASREKPKQTH